MLSGDHVISIIEGPRVNKLPFEDITSGNLLQVVPYLFNRCQDYELCTYP